MPDTCNMHQARGEDIQEMKVALYDHVKPMVEKQAGQWIVLLWCLAGFGVAAMGIAGVLYAKIDDTAAAVIKMDKTMTAHLAANYQKITEINHRLDRCEERGTDLEKRVRSLEQSR